MDKKQFEEYKKNEKKVLEINKLLNKVDGMISKNEQQINERKKQKARA